MNEFLADRVKNVEKSVIRKIFDKTPPDAVNLGLGEIQFKTPQLLLDFAKKVINIGFIRYTQNAGVYELREKIAEYYENIVPAENVCVTVGAEEAVFNLIFCYVNPGDEVMVANPTFVAYKTILDMSNANIVYFDLDPENDFRLYKETFIRKISEKTKMIILNNPSNPLCISFTDEEMELIVERCRKFNVLVIVDEIYRELYTEKRPETFLSKLENVIVVSGISKSHCMTGWRIGWAVSKNPELIKPIITTHQYICTCAPYTAQHVAIKALSKDGMNSVDILRIQLNKNRKKFREFLDSIPNCKILENSSAPYFFVSFGVDDFQLMENLAKTGIIVIPGSVFGSNGKNWIRMNYAVQPDILDKAIEKLKIYLQNNQLLKYSTAHI
ncbi:MAG: pyridoxal phosphate-dependent aminotransferase [Candidatus Cloacimonetes bacterium]|nr:pyridoxal phosphate-dependent aminotransferase [Candidatus Cloacimonadota bacterium]